MPTSVVARLGELDLPDRLAPSVPRLATQLGVALLCAAGIEISRVLVNAIAPDRRYSRWCFRRSCWPR